MVWFIDLWWGISMIKSILHIVLLHLQKMLSISVFFNPASKIYQSSLWKEKFKISKPYPTPARELSEVCELGFKNIKSPWLNLIYSLVLRIPAQFFFFFLMNILTHWPVEPTNCEKVFTLLLCYVNTHINVSGYSEQISSVLSSGDVMGLYFSAPLWLGGSMCLMKLHFWAWTCHCPVSSVSATEKLVDEPGAAVVSLELFLDHIYSQTLPRCTELKLAFSQDPQMNSFRSKFEKHCSRIQASLDGGQQCWRCWLEYPW